jgi:hypothetical protein
MKKSQNMLVYLTETVLKSDEKKSKYSGLSHRNGFVPAYLLSLLRLGKGAARLCTCERRV